jgi:hypothetical protein
MLPARPNRAQKRPTRPRAEAHPGTTFSRKLNSLRASSYRSTCSRTPLLPPPLGPAPLLLLPERPTFTRERCAAVVAAAEKLVPGVMLAGWRRGRGGTAAPRGRPRTLRASQWHRVSHAQAKRLGHACGTGTGSTSGHAVCQPPRARHGAQPQLSTRNVAHRALSADRSSPDDATGLLLRPTLPAGGAACLAALSERLASGAPGTVCCVLHGIDLHSILYCPRMPPTNPTIPPRLTQQLAPPLPPLPVAPSPTLYRSARRTAVAATAATTAAATATAAAARGNPRLRAQRHQCGLHLLFELFHLL